MSNEGNKKIPQSGNYNWKGVMDFIKEEVKTSNSEWTQEKQLLVKKIGDLEKEIKNLKKSNQELQSKLNINTATNNQHIIGQTINQGLGLNAITITSPLNLDRKLIAEKLFHKRGDSDKTNRPEVLEKMSIFKQKVAKSKQNSDDITKSEKLKNIIRRKTKSFGGFEKLLENSLIPNKYNTGNTGNQVLNPQSTSKNLPKNGTTLNTLNLLNGGISNFPLTLSTSNQISSNYYALSSTTTNPSGSSNNLLTSQVNNNSLLISSSFSTNTEVYHSQSSQRTLNSKLIEFSKVLGGNASKLSEKEEESSTQTNHTQETILQKPIDFIDTSSSFNNNSKDIVNLTQISHDNNLFSPFEISNLKCSMNLESSEIINRNSVNFTPKSKEDQNIRKSMNNMSIKNNNSKISYNPFLVIKSHLDAVREIYLSPDKKTLVSVGEDMLINFWDFKKAMKNNKENFEPFLTLRTHTTPIFTLTGPKHFNNVSSNYENCESNYNIFTSGMDGVIRSTRIPSLNLDKNIATYEEISELCHTPWRAHQDMIWDLNYHPIENLMSSVSSDGTVKIFKGNENQNVDKSYYSYDSRSKNLIRQFSFKNNFYNFIEIPTSSYWWMKNPNCIFVSHIAPYIKLYDIETGKAIYDFSYNVEKNIPFECQQANKIVFGENINLLITGHEDRQLRFFDPGQNKIIKNMVAHTDSVSALTQGVKEYEFLSGSHDGSLRCWDIRIFKLLFDIPAHRKKYDEGLLSIKTFPNEKLVITSGADGLIKAFQVI